MKKLIHPQTHNQINIYESSFIKWTNPHQNIWFQCYFSFHFLKPASWNSWLYSSLQMYNISGEMCKPQAYITLSTIWVSWAIGFAECQGHGNSRHYLKKIGMEPNWQKNTPQVVSPNCYILISSIVRISYLQEIWGSNPALIGIFGLMIKYNHHGTNIISWSSIVS